MKLSIETLRLKFRNKICLPLTYKQRKKFLQINDFTIISNNCWGGTVYESYGMKKMSPTVGMFIMPDDYLKFVSKLDYYLSQELEFVEPRNSKWLFKLKHKRNWGTYLIGRLDDIELHMLHYHDMNIAKKKWDSRVKRVNRKHLILKFNDQNGATPGHINEFMDVPFEHKICFVSTKKMKVSDNVIMVMQPRRYKNGIKASREPIGRSKYINITNYINNLENGNERNNLC